MKSNLTSRLALTVKQVFTWATMAVMAMVAHARKAVKQSKPRNHSTLENHMGLRQLLTRSQTMQYCERCKKDLQPETPRDVIEGKVYHIYCGWKFKKQQEWEAVQAIKPTGDKS